MLKSSIQHLLQHSAFVILHFRRGGRVVDGGGLENHCTRKGTRGSNPFPSARLRSPSASFVWASLRLAKQSESQFAKSVPTKSDLVLHEHHHPRADGTERVEGGE
jgi:hypothetical protein